MSERKAGWYWIKIEHSNKWIAGEWIGESSLLKARWANCVEPIEVGPRIPTPDEPWQCVPVEPDEAMVEAALATHRSFDDMALAIQAAIAHAPKPRDV